MHPFRKLAVWSRSRAAAVETYRVTLSFPREERYGIVAQLRRAAVSVVANIVEGSKRLSKREFAHFLNIAEGSAAEAGVLFDLSPELGCGPRERIEPLVREFSGLERQLCALRKKLRE